MDRLPTIDKPRYLIFTDFDETYLSHKMNKKDRMMLHKLEIFLQENCQKLSLMFGFVTGSSFSHLIRKMEKYELKIFPHFIASSLGTEVSYECSSLQGMKDKEWENYIQKSFCRNKVSYLIESIQNLGVSLIPQPPQNNTQQKMSYYYLSNQHDDIQKIKKIIEEKVIQLGLGVNISRCNPLTGDPENAYDIDFVPRESGKQNFVKTFLHKYGVCKENAYAFGDSENDIKMLKSVSHGYFVANAITSPEKWKLKVTSESYAGGILEILTTLQPPQTYRGNSNRY